MSNIKQCIDAIEVGDKIELVMTIDGNWLYPQRIPTKDYIHTEPSEGDRHWIALVESICQNEYKQLIFKREGLYFARTLSNYDLVHRIIKKQK